MTDLGELAWPDVESRRPPLLAVPLGSTEQHGPHLPLSTDTDVAVALVERLAEARPDVLAAPPIAYGASGEHQDFPGTLSIGQEALETLLVELGRSASRTFDRMLVVSGHGGNAATLRRAVDRLRREGRDVRSFSPQWNGDAHAGRTETSVQLALDPDRVQWDRAEAGDLRPIEYLLPILHDQSISAVSPNGVLGDPGEATAFQGRALLQDALEQLLKEVDTWLG